MKKFFVLTLLLLVAASAFAQLESDIQIGFVFSNTRESYTNNDTDFTSKSNRIGVEVANYNYFDDAWYGFFEDVDFQCKRWGTLNNGSDISYDDKSFFAYELMFGPSFRIRNQPEMETRISVGFHYFSQKYTDQSNIEIRDSSLGIGAIVDQKMFTYGRFSFVFGAKVYWDFTDSKTRIINGLSTTGSLSDYMMIGVEPHVLFSLNF